MNDPQVQKMERRAPRAIPRNQSRQRQVAYLQGRRDAQKGRRPRSDDPEYLKGYNGYGTGRGGRPRLGSFKVRVPSLTFKGAANVNTYRYEERRPAEMTTKSEDFVLGMNLAFEGVESLATAGYSQEFVKGFVYGNRLQGRKSRLRVAS